MILSVFFLQYTCTSHRNAAPALVTDSTREEPAEAANVEEEEKEEEEEGEGEATERTRAKGEVVTPRLACLLGARRGVTGAAAVVSMVVCMDLEGVRVAAVAEELGGVCCEGGRESRRTSAGESVRGSESLSFCESGCCKREAEGEEEGGGRAVVRVLAVIVSGWEAVCDCESASSEGQ